MSIFIFIGEFFKKHASVIMSVFGLVISICSAVAVIWTNIIANGNIEIAIYNTINENRKYYTEVLVAYTKDQTELPDEVKEIVRQNAEEMYINAYELACALYLDRKIDPKRFKRTYMVELRTIKQEFSDIIDSPRSSYNAIKKVYEKWENLEK